MKQTRKIFLLHGEESEVRKVLDFINLFYNKMCIVDAGAIKLLGENRDRIINGQNIVITPHLGEFKSLLNILILPFS